MIQEFQQVFFIEFHGIETVTPGIVHVYMAGCAGAHAAANRLDTPGHFPKGFHQMVARLCLQLVCFTEPVFNNNRDHELKLSNSCGLIEGYPANKNAHTNTG